MYYRRILFKFTSFTLSFTKDLLMFPIKLSRVKVWFFNQFQNGLFCHSCLQSDDFQLEKKDSKADNTMI